jgi:hypothetical protein
VLKPPGNNRLIRLFLAEVLFSLYSCCMSEIIPSQAPQNEQTVEIINAEDPYASLLTEASTWKGKFIEKQYGVNALVPVDAESRLQAAEEETKALIFREMGSFPNFMNQKARSDLAPKIDALFEEIREIQGAAQAWCETEQPDIEEGPERIV